MTNVIEYEEHGKQLFEQEVELEFTKDQWLYYHQYLTLRDTEAQHAKEVEAVRATVKYLHLGVLPSAGEETEGGNEGGCC